MYRVLMPAVEPPDHIADFFLDDRFDESWFSGSAFSAAPPNPLELSWDPENEDGRRLEYYGEGMVLMTHALVAALHSEGIDNFDTYPVVIHSALGNPDCHDYVAVNILGMLRAADLEASNLIDEGDNGGLLDVTFEGFAVDTARALGLTCFRLAESAGTVLVHERVAERFNALGGLGVRFVEPALHLT